MDSMTRPTASAGFDRLAALRDTTSTPAKYSRYTFRTNVLVGLLCVLAGMTMVVGFVVFSSTTTQTPVNSLPDDESVVPNESALLAGEAYVAIAVDSGKFPPGVAVGDVIKVAVTPGMDGTGDSKLLPEKLLVVEVTSAGEMSSQTIFTVRAPETLVPALATSGPMHIAHVGLGQS